MAENRRGAMLLWGLTAKLPFSCSRTATNHKLVWDRDEAESCAFPRRLAFLHHRSLGLNLYEMDTWRCAPPWSDKLRVALCSLTCAYAIINAIFPNHSFILECSHVRPATHCKMLPRQCPQLLSFQPPMVIYLYIAPK